MAKFIATIQINPSDMDLVINLVKTLADNYDDLPVDVQIAVNKFLEDKCDIKTPYEAAIEYTDIIEKVRG